jgi:hypothetical protein
MLLTRATFSWPTLYFQKRVDRKCMAYLQFMLKVELKHLVEDGQVLKMNLGMKGLQIV